MGYTGLCSGLCCFYGVFLTGLVLCPSVCLDAPGYALGLQALLVLQMVQLGTCNVHVAVTQACMRDALVL